MSSARTFPIGKESLREQPVNILTPDQQSTRKVGHKETQMAPRRHEDDALERIEKALDRQSNSNGLGAWGRTFATMAVVLIGWIFSALYIAKTTETEIRVSNARMEEQLKQTREDFLEYRKNTERELKLADERYRQISIMLESRGVTRPRQ